ncbi:uncharacterized protein LOC115741837 isoform X2 [Rhodamnia argentea]|uniref:Uncharacterized protein LOC115741837 isoform X2 n=1 Tax=Rhodamnia argentea TaxID=178133 RepID=A0A8B8PAL8_9MYRT|nr:uncharacterized protein LOC115741837 isoform X2 [Rhodamnia argentea]
MEAARKGRGRRKPSASKADPNEDGRTTRAVEENATPLLEVRVWPFDCSIENHFRAVDSAAELCGEAEVGALDDGEIARLSSSISFSSDANKEWRYLNYEPRVIKFAKETRHLQKQDAGIEVTLPPFSSATVPQDNGPHAGCNSKDFVIYVGGAVWALDWCPRVRHRPEYQTKNEFIAVAAHPRGSSQHKLGVPLTGRGVIQMWSLLNVSGDEEEASLVEKPRQRRVNSQSLKAKSSQPPKPRGRPRKKPLERPSDDLNCNSQFGQPLASDFPEKTPVSYTLDGVSGVLNAQVTGKDSARKRRSREAAASPNTSRRSNNVSAVESCHVDEHVSIMTENEETLLPCINQQGHSSGFGECSAANNAVGSNSRSGSGTLLSEDVATPRLVFCLAHNGKVAWDVKWRPFDMHETKCTHLMGYLAVLLGNGSLEVWEVPLPQTANIIYCSTQREDTDPRFVKLEPVFRCSTLKSGGIQSIPLSVEWSTSHPHEYLLVGCHDGTVALWKFFASNSSKDTRPLLHFTADTVPVRAVAWAPFGSDPESVNVIVTAGHGGIKFWDMRDPFHPLWHIHSAPKNILSLDWLPDPRCVLLSFDDGTVRLLSLSRSAYDGPVTGKPLCGTKQGLHTMYCSSFAIWSVHVSRHTGMVAYSGADGNVCQFQLTYKAVDKDAARHRAPHFLCASVAEDGSAVVLNMTPSDIPVALGKPLKGTPSSMREMLSASPEVEEAMENEAEGQTPDEQTLALCYGDDPSVESGWEETLSSFKNKRNQISGKLNKKKLRVEIQRDKEPETVPEGADTAVTSREFKTFPPKIVAMHRVRWNMNKGSWKWLCSGGAAGIVRCQEIDMLSTDPKSKRK